MCRLLWLRKRPPAMWAEASAHRAEQDLRKGSQSEALASLEFAPGLPRTDDRPMAPEACVESQSEVYVHCQLRSEASTPGRNLCHVRILPPAALPAAQAETDRWGLIPFQRHFSEAQFQNRNFPKNVKQQDYPRVMWLPMLFSWIVGLAT